MVSEYDETPSSQSFTPPVPHHWIPEPDVIETNPLSDVIETNPSSDVIETNPLTDVIETNPPSDFNESIEKSRKSKSDLYYDHIEDVDLLEDVDCVEDVDRLEEYFDSYEFTEKVIKIFFSFFLFYQGQLFFSRGFFPPMGEIPQNFFW